MGLYISREFGSKYPAVKSLGIRATNVGKKVMVRGWLYGEKISISISDIFDLKSQSNTLLQCLGKLTEKFLVIDKPEYDVVLGWYNMRNSVKKIIISLQIFYELICPNFKTYDIDQNVSIDLDKYCNSSYSETETETESISSDLSYFSESEVEEIVASECDELRYNVDRL
ncbi:9549_t:CDS:2 [Funneliformis mosseae]|uniref:9549_t:CDS:1 n=1 Tax=Funneliformis mosseae TaxID=27381 RepID=A0A9N9N6W7_FUNMO|nr:9549_t:CDS:2 [Funneliformis mosseae]